MLQHVEGVCAFRGHKRDGGGGGGDDDDDDDDDDDECDDNPVRYNQ